VSISQRSLGNDHPQTQHIIQGYFRFLEAKYINEDMGVLLQLLGQIKQDGIPDKESP
jgi:hypothetical protein